MSRRKKGLRWSIDTVEHARQHIGHAVLYRLAGDELEPGKIAGTRGDHVLVTYPGSAVPVPTQAHQLNLAERGCKHSGKCAR